MFFAMQPQSRVIADSNPKLINVLLIKGKKFSSEIDKDGFPYRRANGYIFWHYIDKKVIKEKYRSFENTRHADFRC